MMLTVPFVSQSQFNFGNAPYDKDAIQKLNFAMFATQKLNAMMMTRTFLLINLLFFCLPFVSAQDFEFVTQSKTNAQMYIQEVRSIAHDGLSSVYLAGHYRDDLMIGNDILYNNGNADVSIFICKMGEDLTIEWIKDIKGSPYSPYVFDVYADSNKVLFAGTFNEILHIDTLSFSEYGSSTYIVNLKPDGSINWVKTIYTVNSPIRTKAMTCDRDGNIYIAGGFNTDISIDTITVSTASSDQDAFVAKLDSNGVAQWIRIVESNNVMQGAGEALGVGVDVNRNVYLTGMLFSTVGIFDSIQLTKLGTRDLFVAKYNEDGDIQWASNYGNPGVIAKGQEVEIVDSNTIYISGELSGSAGFKLTDSNYIGNPTGAENFFITQIDSMGHIMWSTHGTHHGAKRVKDLCSDTAGNLYAAGRFEDQLGTLYSSPYSFHGFVNKYADSSVYSVKAGNGTAFSNVSAICTNNKGKLFIGGEFSDSLKFDADTLTTRLLHYDNHDVFYASMCSGQTNLADIVVVDSAFVNDSISFENLSSLSANWKWDFDDGTIDSLAWNPVHVYDHADTFYYSLVVDGLCGIDTAIGEIIIRIDPTSSIAESTTENTLRVFPNPTSNEIIIRFADMASDYTYALYDITGKQLTANKNSSKQNAKLSLEAFPAGVYILKVKKGEREFSKKILKY